MKEKWAFSVILQEGKYPGETDGNRVLLVRFVQRHLNIISLFPSFLLSFWRVSRVGGSDTSAKGNSRPASRGKGEGKELLPRLPSPSPRNNPGSEWHILRRFVRTPVL